MIKTLKELIQLHIDFSRGGKITKLGLQSFMASIPQLPKIKSLVLGFCDQPIGDLGASTIAKEIGKLEELANLSIFLQNANLSELGVSYIVNAIDHLKNLCQLSLNFSNQNLSDKSVEMLKILQTSPKLENIHLNLSRYIKLSFLINLAMRLPTVE
jgi:hypothetical protein